MAGVYSFWYFLFFPLMAFGSVMGAAMRGAGNAVRPAVYSIGCILLKAVLTPLLCFQLNMGIRGAALATAVSFLLFFVLMATDLLRGTHGLSRAWLKVRPGSSVFAGILRSGFVAAQIPVLASVVLLIVLQVMSARSSALADAFSLAKRFELYLIQLTVCLGCGMMVVMGASKAAGNEHRVREALRASLKLLFWAAMPVALFMFFCSDLFYGSLTSDPVIINEGRKVFVWGGFHMLFTLGMILLNFGFQGIGRPIRALPFLLFSIGLVQGGGSWLLRNASIDSAGYYALISVGSAVAFLLALRTLARCGGLPLTPAGTIWQPVAACSRLRWARVVTITLLVISAIAAIAQECFELKLKDPVQPDQPALTYPVELSLDASGFPRSYRMFLRTGVCLDGSCKMLDAVLKWDALGNYIGFEYENGAPLTKNHHDPFTEADYKKLDSILKDRRSILGTHPLNYFVGKPDPSMAGVDAVTAATPKAARAAIVEGAAYSSWVLWHWVNGEIVDQLRSRTQALAGTDYLLHCLNSSDRRFERFALDQLVETGLNDPRHRAALFQTLENSGRANCELALHLLTESAADLKETHRRLIAMIGQNGGSSRLILNYFEQLPDPDPAVWVQLAEQLNDIPGYRDLDAVMALLKKHASDSATVRNRVSALLESEDRFIAMRAAEFFE